MEHKFCFHYYNFACIFATILLDIYLIWNKILYFNSTVASPAPIASSSVAATAAEGAVGGLPQMAHVGDGCAEMLPNDVEQNLESMSVAVFLSSIGLENLCDIFENEKITMDILVEMKQEELKEIGITAYGHRFKILKGIEKLKSNQSKKLSSLSL